MGEALDLPWERPSGVGKQEQTFDIEIQTKPPKPKEEPKLKEEPKEHPKMPKPPSYEVKETESGEIEVTKNPVDEQVPEARQAIGQLVGALVNTPRERIGEMTRLPSVMALLLSLQHILNPKTVFKPGVDLPSEWEYKYMQYQRSVGGDHYDSMARLAEMEIAGSVEGEEASLGSPQ